MKDYKNYYELEVGGMVEFESDDKQEIEEALKEHEDQGFKDGKINHVFNPARNKQSRYYN